VSLGLIGAATFGLVIGWITYRTLARKAGAVGISDIATVIGAIGGAAVTALFRSEDLFGGYSVGLVIGFFAYFVVYLLLYGKAATKVVMGD